MTSRPSVRPLCFPSTSASWRLNRRELKHSSADLGSVCREGNDHSGHLVLKKKTCSSPGRISTNTTTQEKEKKRKSPRGKSFDSLFPKSSHLYSKCSWKWPPMNQLLFNMFSPFSVNLNVEDSNDIIRKSSAHLNCKYERCRFIFYILTLDVWWRTGRRAEVWILGN